MHMICSISNDRHTFNKLQKTACAHELKISTPDPDSELPEQKFQSRTPIQEQNIKSTIVVELTAHKNTLLKVCSSIEMISINNSYCKYHRSKNCSILVLVPIKCQDTYIVRSILTGFDWYRVFLGTDVEDGSRPCYICCEFIKIVTCLHRY